MTDLLDALLNLGMLFLAWLAFAYVLPDLWPALSRLRSLLGVLHPFRSLRNLREHVDGPVGLAQHLALLARRGLPLVSGLRAYASDLRGTFAKALLSVADRVEEGLPLSEAMATQPGHFSPRFVAIVRTGEESATLPDLMESYASRGRSIEKTRRRAVIFLLYPLTAGWVILCCMEMFARRIYPQLRAMFEEMDLPLPALTRLWFVQGWRILFVCLMVLLVYVAIRVISVPSMQRLQGRKSPIVPWALSWLLGGGERARSVATFCEALSVLLKAGIPTARAVALASDPGSVGYAGLAMARLCSAVDDGEKLSTAMARELRLCKSDAWLLSAAEGSRALPDALAEIARRYQDREEKRIARAAEVMLPVCVLILGLIVLGTSVAFFSPLVVLHEILAATAN